jgi:hypothetical protein
MEASELRDLRLQLQKTQKQMSQLLGTSLKAVQSFEQGWRDVPVHVERQALFLMAMKRGNRRQAVPCWDVRNCPVRTRNNCPAWEFDCGDLCWFVNGTLCEGKPEKSWDEKIKVCRACQVFGAFVDGGGVLGPRAQTGPS